MIRLIRRLFRERAGSLAVEFVVGLPLIILAQAIVFETGRVLLDQHALEAGVRDAARYLARANITACPAQGSAYWLVYNRLVVSGVQSSMLASDITCSFTELYDGESNTLRTDFTRVQIIAEVTVETPLIAMWGGGITIAAQDQARFIGE